MQSTRPNTIMAAKCIGQKAFDGHVLFLECTVLYC